MLKTLFSLGLVSHLSDKNAGYASRGNELGSPYSRNGTIR